jgi:hypothetical protein
MNSRSAFAAMSRVSPASFSITPTTTPQTTSETAHSSSLASYMSREDETHLYTPSAETVTKSLQHDTTYDESIIAVTENSLPTDTTDDEGSLTNDLPDNEWFRDPGSDYRCNNAGQYKLVGSETNYTIRPQVKLKREPKKGECKTELKTVAQEQEEQPAKEQVVESATLLPPYLQDFTLFPQLPAGKCFKSLFIQC